MEYPPALCREATRPFRGVYFDGLRMIVELDPQALAEAETGYFPPDQPSEEVEPEVAEPRSDRVALIEIGHELWRLDLACLVQVLTTEESPIPSPRREVPSRASSIMPTGRSRCSVPRASMN